MKNNSQSNKEEEGPLHPEVKEYLDKLDGEQRPFDSFDPEHDIAKKLQDILFASNEKENYKLTDEDEAEQNAFGLSPDTRDKQFALGTYYVSGLSSKTPVTEKRLDYWTHRANKAQHPILSARYADLVVEFFPRNKRIPPELFQKVIDSNMSVCQKNLAYPLNSSIKIKRALNLAILIKDPERIRKVKKTMIALAKQAAKDTNQARICYGIFERLILDDDKKVTLDKEEKSCLVEIMEDILSKGKNYPAMLNDATCRLAKYYAKEEDQDNLIRILSIYEKSMKAIKYDDSNALLKSSIYGNIQRMYEKYSNNNFKRVKAAASRIIKERAGLKLDWDKSLDKVCIKTSISQQTVDDFIKRVFGDEGHKNGLQGIIWRIANFFLIKESDMKREFEKQAQKSLLGNSNAIQEEFLSPDNKRLAASSDKKNNDDNRLMYHTFLYLTSQEFFLWMAMTELEDRFCTEKVIKCFRDAKFFNEEENVPLLEKALSGYWAKDYLSASHFFCPLIETVVRNLADEAGCQILKPNQYGGDEYRSLSVLLKDKKIFSKINSDICFYLRVILAEPVGMNLRNDWAHGSERGKFYQRVTSDRLLHVMMVLLCISIEENRKKTA